MKPFPESDALHERARAFIAAFELGAPMPEPFDALARDIAAFQAKHIPGYAKLRAARKEDVPCVPTDVFKMARIATFPKADAVATFRTSGTTIGDRGVHEMRTTATYDAGAIAFGRSALRFDRQPLVVSLTVRDGDSSLGHMVEQFRLHIGGGDGGNALDGDVIDLAWLDEVVAKALHDERPVLFCATSFALVMLLDALDRAPFRLPARSLVMQTGGFKGRVRTVEPDVLRRDLARTFCISEGAIVSEYGMTELSSQFYAHGEIYVEPPWARIVPVDPETLAPVADGAVGLARIDDLLNVDSAVSVLARDRVRRSGAGFVLLGRSLDAPPRGCSIAIEEMLE
jgi:hypothetical protein